MNWLFLRGLIREQRHWDQLPRLFEHAGHSVFFLDLPGLGKNRDASVPSQIQDYVPLLRAQWLLLRERSSEPWSLLAMSLGGMLALEWMHQFPQDFKQGVIINSSASNVQPFYRRFNLASLPQILRLFISTNPHSVERTILKLTTTHPEKYAHLAESWIRFQPERVRSVFIKQLLAASRFHAPPRLLPPLLFLASSADRLVDPSCSQALAEKYQAPILLHSWAGHDLPLEDPEWVLRASLNWPPPRLANHQF